MTTAGNKSLTEHDSGIPHSRVSAYVAITATLLAAYFIVIYVQQVYLNESVLPYQLFIPNDVITTLSQYHIAPYVFGTHFFSDYQVIWIEAAQKSPYLTTVAPPGDYPPILFLVFRIWSEIPYKAGLFVFMVATLIGCVLPLCVWLPSKSITSRTRDTIIIGFFSLPVLATLDRGNFEGLTAGLLAGGVLAYTRQRYWLCAVLIASAGSVKFYVIAFVVILLWDWKWREALFAVGLWAAGIFGGLLFFAGGYGANLRAMVHDVSTFAGSGMTFHTAIYFNRSLYGLLVVLHYWMTGNTTLGGFVVIHYTALCIVLAVVFIAASTQRKYLRLWQRLLLICTAVTVLPNYASGYTYLVLLVPIALYLREESPSWQFFVYGLPLALVMIPKGIGIDFVQETEITWLNVVNPALLVYLGCALVIECAWNANLLSMRKFRPLHTARQLL